MYPGRPASLRDHPFPSPRADAPRNSPLCIEEFDLSDRNFRPCPCGYQVCHDPRPPPHLSACALGRTNARCAAQICQFCFNNLKNNLNGLCPACRRPYDEKTIRWKVVTPEE